MTSWMGSKEYVRIKKSGCVKRVETTRTEQEPLWMQASLIESAKSVERELPEHPYEVVHQTHFTRGHLQTWLAPYKTGKWSVVRLLVKPHHVKILYARNNASKQRGINARRTRSRPKKGHP